MGGRHHDEVERKYDVDPSAVFPNLAEADGVGSVRQANELRLEAVYFDTTGLDLARRGVTLRRRSGGADAGWHLKVPAGRDTRREVHEPLGPTGEPVPIPLLARVRAIVRDRALVPVASVSTTRREYRLCGDDGAVLARVCDDQVQAQRLDRHEPAQSWREWEVELDGGPSSLLDAVQEQLIAAGASTAAASSKLGRLLGDLPEQAPAAASRKDLAKGAAGQLLVAHLAEHTTRLHAQDAGIRGDQVEAVHKLRIAARRLRSALTTFGPLLDRTVSDPVREELRWLGEALAPARDAQVLREHFAALISAEPPELVIGSVAVRIDDQLSAAYQTGRERALEALDSERYLRLLDALDKLIASPPLNEDADKAARKAVPRLLARDIKRLTRAVRAIEAAQDPEDRDLAFHEARKKAKRLRYAAEAAEPVLGKRARSLAASAKTVQETLGLHQDSVVARQRLREYGVQAHLDGDNAFTFGRLHALEQARAERAEADFAAVWSGFWNKEISRWLG